MKEKIGLIVILLIFTIAIDGYIGSSSSEKIKQKKKENGFPIQLNLSMEEIDFSSPEKTLSSRYSSALDRRYQDYKNSFSDDCWEIMENVMDKKGWSINEYLENTLLYKRFQKIEIVDIIDFKGTKIVKLVIYNEGNTGKLYTLSTLAKLDDTWIISCKHNSDPEYHKIAVEWASKNNH